MAADAIVARRRSELRAKFKALPSELGHWAALSGAGAPFEKHYTQIRRVSAQVLGLHDEIAGELEQLKPPGAVLTQARTLELRLLAVHSVWDYFRVKFLLRSQEPFASVLMSADAFAWACYEPVQREHAQTATHRREPPLVTPQNQWSPTALPRDKAYDVVRSPGGWTNTNAFARVIERLPIPILGLPWHALEHLPHLALLAHEVGHVVESDFGLENVVEKALKRAIAHPNRQAAWSSWRSEVFADLFACYAAGSAFAWALMDTVAADVGRIIGETKTAADGWGPYPTTTLRLLLNAECVRQTVSAAEADAMVAEWQEAYKTHQMLDFQRDLPLVVRGLLEAGVLPDSLYFKHVAPDAAKAYLYLSQDMALDRAPFEPRALVAAVARTYRENPERDYSAIWNSVRKRIVSGRVSGVLAGDIPITTTVDDLDRKAGRALAREFLDEFESDVD